MSNWMERRDFDMKTMFQKKSIKTSMKVSLNERCKIDLWLF